MTSSMRALASILLLGALTACGGSDSGPGGGGTTAPTAASIALTASNTAPLASVGETVTLTALVRDASQAALANPTVSYASSNASVATVSGSGTSATVTAVGDGTTTITATSGSVSATATVTVAQKLSALTLTPASPTLTIGATATLVASARDARGNAIAGVSGYTFTTGRAATAIVNSTGVVTAIAPGTTTIAASITRDGTTANATANVTVSTPLSGAATAAVGTTDATFTVPSVTIAVGGTVTWTFGATSHNVIFSSAGAPTNVPISASSSVSRTFPTAGTFPYACTLHAGMNGTVIVAAPSLMALLNGANERPTATSSTGNGAALIAVNGSTVNYTVAYQGITGAPTGLHIHSPATTSTNAGISVDLLTTPLTGTSGVLTGSFTASAIRTAGVSLDSLVTLLRNGNAYVNIHSSTFPAGEIRGQVTVP